MGAADRERWDARYVDLDPDLDVVAAPPDALVTGGLVDRVPTSGHALDVACGVGAQTIWLARRGLDVTALDVSGEAIARLDTALSRQGLEARVRTMTVDLDDGLPDDHRDFDVIVCQRFRDTRLYAQFVSRLRPGGLLVVTVLSRTGARDPGPFHAPRGELRAAFDRMDCTVLDHRELDGEESIVAESKGSGRRSGVREQHVA